MRKIYLLLIFILAVSVIFVSCEKNDAVPSEDSDVTVPSDIVCENEQAALPEAESSYLTDESDTEAGDSSEADSESEDTEDQSTSATEADSGNEITETETVSYAQSETKAPTPAVTTADTAAFDFDFETADTTAAETNKENEEPVIPPVPSSHTIIEGGTYSLSGTVTDQMITVNAPSSEVTIILNGATVRNSKGPAIYVRAASKVTINLASGTINTLSDGSSYSITESGSKLDGVIFSKADLTINGSGTLHVYGNCKHGIVSKDDLIISSGIINVSSKNIGINGKDCVKINSGNITVNAGTSGITSDNNTEAAKGFIYLYGGSIRITAGNDGIIAQNILNIENVSLNIKSGGGSTSASNLAGSFKGLKAGSDIYIKGGYFNVDSKDDCIHSNGTITVSGGTYTLSTADDAIHADTDLAVSGSTTSLTISKSNEGIEAKNLVISGGAVSVNTSGNGLDANGFLAITGGNITISVSGSRDTSVFKYDTSGTINGGTFFGTGSYSNEQAFDTSSGQGSLKLNAEGAYADSVTVKNSEGATVFSGTSSSAYSFIIISTPQIIKGGTYFVTAGSVTYEITAE